MHLDPPPSIVKLVSSEYDADSETTKDNIQPDSIWKKWLLSLFTNVETLNRVIIELVPAGYGGGRQIANVALDIPSGSFNTLPFDTLSPATQRGVTFDTASNTLSFSTAGVWTVMINMSIQNHNSNNGGRVFTVRPFNITQAITGDGFVVGVGRNVQDTFVSISFLAEISQANVDNNDSFRIEVGNADTAITGGTLVASGIQTTHSSELGLLG